LENGYISQANGEAWAKVLRAWDWREEALKAVPED